MQNLLDAVVDAHGGMDRWTRVKAIDVAFNFSGAVLALKGFPDHLRPRCSVDIVGCRTVFQGLGGNPTDRWIFTADRCWTERLDGSVIEERKHPRDHFAGHDFKTTKWDDLDLTYFLGYAMWNYLSFPFLLTHPGFEHRELAEHHENGEVWRVMEVTFPDDVPAHTKVQQFYFGPDNLLRRFDYSTDVLGGVAAHYCFDLKEFGGITMPTLRRVVSRTSEGAQVSGRTGFLLDYTNVEVRS